MTKKTLYRVTVDGKTTVSPQMPTGVDYTITYRWIADEGMILYKEETDEYAACIDADTIDGWIEVEAPEPPEPPEE